MDGWIAKRISDIACEAYASDVSPALTELVHALHDSYCNNFPSALFVLGVHLLHLHYELLLQLVGGVPVGVLYGDVQTGKSTAMEAALSLLGTQESHYRKRCSDVRFLQITSQTTLGLVLDDLTQAQSLVGKIILHTHQLYMLTNSLYKFQILRTLTYREKFHPYKLKSVPGCGTWYSNITRI